MQTIGFWPTLTLTVLAIWRVTHLLAAEDGPGNLVLKLRVLLGTGILGQAMDCFFCLSLWIAAPFALLLSTDPSTWALAWLALSGGACLLERIGQPGEPPPTHTTGV